MDYDGPVVTQTSRIQEQAQGGEVTVSDAFILAVWRCQNNGEAPERETTDDLRRNLISKEICPKIFKLEFRVWVKMKGLADLVYVTLISCRQNVKICRTFERKLA